MKKHIIQIGLGIAVLLLLLIHVARIYEFSFITQLDAIIYDARLRLTMPKSMDKRVVIIDIDEKSLAEEGRWPWGRDRMAVLVDKLFERHHVAQVGFDIVFAERDDSSGLKVLQELSQKDLKDVAQFQSTFSRIKPLLDHDMMFAKAIKDRPVILGYYFSTSDNVRKAGTSGTLPLPVLPRGAFKKNDVNFTLWDGYGANLPELQASATSAGHFNPYTDIDGVSRRVPTLVEYNGAYYESLSLAMVRLRLGSPKISPGYASDRNWTNLEWLNVGQLKVPVDDRVTTLIPFRGGQGSFQYVSATDILHDRISPADLKDKIILVGTTAPGLLDLRSTPVAGVYPGVEIHANMIVGMLDNNIKQRPPYVLGAEVMLMLLAGIALAVLLPLLSPFVATLTTSATLLAVVGLNYSVWQYGNFVMPLASTVLLILGLFALNMSYGFFVESRLKRQITGLFGQYVSPLLVDEMALNPQKITMEGESRDLTVLFSDVRNFTTISEGLDPKELTQLMNEFLTPLTQVIYRHRGTIDKYMGDCIMAFWGAPVEDAQHPRNALLAGLEMLETLKQLQPKFREKGWPEIKIGVGMNTGRMSVGNMGSEVRVAYTVMGDAVNLASRLESITKQYGVEIIVGEATKVAVPDFLFRELDRVRVKGKREPVAIFEPLGIEGQVDKAVLDELKLFSQVVKLYRAQNWDMAELQLLNLQKSAANVQLYQLYLERIAYFRANPPGENWDGVFDFATK